ncbi:MAG: DNA repair protein RecO [Eubacteriales bacterium]|nr:DNA repair protein RecO [Eubacteriales bacterium]
MTSPSEHLHLRAIVLRSYDYLDRDRFIDILSRERGLISLRCRQVRGRQAGLQAITSVFTYAAFDIFSSRDRYSLDSAELIYPFKHLKTDLASLSAATHISEMVREVLREGVDEGASAEAMALFEEVLYAYNALDQKTADPLVLALAFSFRCLKIIGMGLQVSGTASEEKLFFSISDQRFYRSPAEASDSGRRFSPHEKREIPSAFYLPMSVRRIFEHLDRSTTSKAYRFSLRDQSRELFVFLILSILDERFDKPFKTIRELQQIDRLRANLRPGSSPKNP